VAAVDSDRRSIELETGSIVIYASENLRGYSAVLSYWKDAPLLGMAVPIATDDLGYAPIVDTDGFLRAAFPDLAPGHYLVRLDSFWRIKYNRVTVYPGVWSEVDWRLPNARD
jgi:hypothetical protein